MKKNNNQGFTLIELLAVVVILLAISVIAIASISAAIERNKTKQNSTKMSVLESYAKLYYDQHKSAMENNRISIADLNLSQEESLDADGDPICGYFEVTNGKFTFVESPYDCYGTLVTKKTS